MHIRSLLEEMVARGASDLHMKVGSPPSIRVDGELIRMEHGPLGTGDVERLIAEIASPEHVEAFDRTHEGDFSFGLSGVARFRVNVCHQRGTLAATLRLIPTEVPALSELRLPPVLEELSLRRRGLILVTGTVGSGKSTSLAAMVGVINHHRRAKVITIEDPIEFLHADDKSVVMQREVGVDTLSFASAMRRALRQDPDVILVGEIRDPTSMSIALTAANTGHLVFSTLHTIDAAQTVNRVISFFPPHQHRDVRMLLASCLQAVVSLRLVPTTKGGGRVPAVELLIVTDAVKEYLRDPEKTPLIRDLIAEGGSEYGMQTFDQSLMHLYRDGEITREDALRYATQPSEFELQLSGIQGGSDFDWKPIPAGGEPAKPGSRV